MARVFADPLRERVGRYGVILGLDATFAAISLHAAMALRFDGAIPEPWASAMPRAVVLVVVVRLAANLAASLHCWSFRLAGLPDAVRVATAALTGTALIVSIGPWLAPPRLPLTVYALEFFMSSSAFAVVRFGPRVAVRWWTERRRRRSGAVPTLVVGVNFAAELLARDILRTPQLRYDLVGFVGTDPWEIGRRLDGKPILGVVGDLATLVERHHIGLVLLAIPRPAAASLRKIIALCASLRVQFKILPAFSSLADEVSAAMLDDVAPEDLLPRPPVEFDRAELQRLIAGRRVLVTGAGGSIGGEICRQLVHYGVRQLVMVDMNENELYLRARRIAEERPEVDVRAEVADVREVERITRLGDRYRPEYVFHAAAHKHVPLMEDAPGEAIKNNVFGTLHVARMADRCGARRFVLISTDKAVNPSSVMGVSKRAAELVVRDLARTSRTRMSAVRFGNVLGSAGSVVPLFKEQIARGGPVTVTHPSCTRYFMTIPEAVGLVLVSGLGDYGELCVLDMGEPIKNRRAGPAHDRALRARRGRRHPDRLHRPPARGEARGGAADRGGGADARRPGPDPHRPVAPPPADLAVRLAELRRLADAGDAEPILLALQALVPTYRPRRAGDVVATPVPAGRAAAASLDPRPRMLPGAPPLREPAGVAGTYPAPA